MTPTMRAYQAMKKAAADVVAGKTGAKTRLAAAKKRYVTLSTATAQKDADEKIKKAKKNADAVGKAKRAPATKKKTAAKKKPAAKKKTTAKRRTTR